MDSSRAFITVTAVVGHRSWSSRSRSSALGIAPPQVTHRYRYGIGESKAKAIVEYRAAEPFKSVDDLEKVKGIGDKMLEALLLAAAA